MRACCLRVFVDGQLWDCLFVVRRGRRRYALYASAGRLPFRAPPDQLARDPEPTAAVDANALERAIKALECSDALKRAVVRSANFAVVPAVAAAAADSFAISVRDVGLVTPAKYRLAYTW